MAADGTVKILIQADGKEAIGSVDDLVTRLDGIGGAGRKAGGILKSVLGANLISSAITTGISAIKDGLVSMAGDLSSASATWQTFNANMKNIGMPDQEIKSTTKQLQKFAQATIYSSSDMATTFSQLRAVGTKNTTQLIKGFGGLAAAAENPGQAMKTLSQQATQMAAKPKVQWEDFKLMLEQTPAGIAAVAKTMGKSTSQLITDIQAGKVSTQSFFDAINKAGNAPGFQKMATQYKTVGQATDGLRETLTNQLLPSFNKVNSALIGVISKMVDAVGEMDFTGLANATVTALDAVANAIAFVSRHADELKAAAVAVATFLIAFKAIKMVTNFKKSIADTATVLKAFQAALGVGPWGILAAAIAAIVVGLTYFFTKTKTGQVLWAKFVAWIKKAGSVFAAVGNSIKQLIAAGLAKLAPIASAVGAAFAKLGPFFKAVGVAISGLVSTGLSKLVAWFAQLSNSTGKLMSGGMAKLGPLMASLGAAVQKLMAAGLSRLGPLLDSMGGAFGKAGALIGPLISILTKLGLAAVGISGPWGMVISMVASFLGMWAKTGQLNADGITAVFDKLTSNIESVSGAISKYLPQIVTIGTDLLVKLIDGITAALPQLVTAATDIITGLAEALSKALPALVDAGTQILLMVVQAIVTALPQLVTAALAIVTGLLDAVIGALPTLVDAGVQILTAVIQGIVAVLPMLLSAALQIIMGIVKGLVAALPVIISAGLQIITALVHGLITMLPAIISAAIQILMALVNGLMAALPALLQAAVQIILSLAGALIDALPQIIDAGIKLLLALIEGLISILPALIDAALKLVMALAGALIDNLPKIIAAGIKLLTALISGLIKMIPALINGALQIIIALAGALIKNAPRILAAGVKLIAALIKGLLQLLGQVGGAATKLGSKVIKAIADKGKDMLNAGVDFVKGFIGGIGKMAGKVWDAAKDIGKKAVDGVKKFLHIGSPSRVMRQMGVWTGQGFTNGIKDMLPKVSSMSDKMAAAAMFDTPDVSLGAITGRSGALRAEQLIGSMNQRVPSAQTINNYKTNQISAESRIIEVHVHAILDKHELAQEMTAPIRVNIDRANRLKEIAKGKRRNDL
ncbi:tape measure protein [Lacticaseibacillus absianus]|uniref:tape measure protein n=1 Tax=Lacticaseibacillus absianus TaxID=2729623 RepID=UPI0015C886CD|nr:tape measure protein [Lacticaseibacillus absianus]